ncbi:MFS transporter [Paenibacillus qinlingensis]|uniref:MFS family arabinose efflux permease n=1 Tax=Paenibacillus qinlingensis TaxID=1837343 RepID=A0ABU1P3Q8_9BACL|nr:MFS transporter [Paenibacillus qinlingensis]MDR6554395.1 putative MFS family arabinose efflux permease [Paenibacillus qinlingensis]
MFKNRYVRTILLSRVLLQLGIWIRNFAILLYISDITHNNPQYLSLISIVETAPIFIFAFIGGTFADRWQPKRTMVWSDLLSAATVFLVLLTLLSGSWYALLIGTFISASLSQFSQPSAMKLYKKNVPAEHLQGVMAMSQSLVAIFMVLGPVMGTFIYLNYGVEASLILTGVMFFGSSIVLMFLPKDEMEEAASGAPHFLKELKAGLHYVYTNRALRTLSLTFGVTGLAAGLIQPLALFIAVEKLELSKQSLQWFLMANGAAMLIGGTVIMGIAKKVNPQVLLATGLLVSAVCTIGVGASTLVSVTLILQIVSGLFYPCIHVGIQTLIMRNTEGPFIGRVGGAITPIFMGMMLVGMSFSGYLKDMTSLLTVYVLSGALLIAGVVLLNPLLGRNQQKANQQAM